MKQIDYIVPLGVPVRLLAIEWREHWEFDFPCLLLAPVVRYYCGTTDTEDAIEDVASTLALNWELGKACRQSLTPGELHEFSWRGWCLKEIADMAEFMLATGKSVDFGAGLVEARETVLRFGVNADGDVIFDALPPGFRIAISRTWGEFDLEDLQQIIDSGG